jgi:uncharacterized integral membrane protein
VRVVRLVLGGIIVLVLISFLLSNRDGTGVSFWPFGLLAELPVGALVLAALVLGFVAGLTWHLPQRLRAGRRAKSAEKRVAVLEAQIAAQQPATVLPAKP